MTATVSIVLVNYNTCSALRMSLASVARELERARAPTECIVVDNASTDGSAAMVKASFPWVQLIESESNLGFAKANNLGADAASGEYLFILNPDAMLVRGSIDRLVAELDADGSIAVVGPWIRDVDAAIGAPRLHAMTEAATRRIRSIEWWQNRFPRVRLPYVVSYLLPPRRLATSYAVSWVLNAAAMVRRSALRGEPVMDERFFIGTEEIERDRVRLATRGYRFRIVPEAQVLHLVGETYRAHPELAHPALDLAQGAVHYRRAQVYSPAWARLDSLVAAADFVLRSVALALRSGFRMSDSQRSQASAFMHSATTAVALAIHGVNESERLDRAFRVIAGEIPE